MGSKAKSSKTLRKDPLKTPKVWERARREKMKIYFNELQEILPFYDPSTPMSRFEILQKSKTYIKDLQDQNQDLLNGGFDEVYKNKMNKLKQRVKELLKRVDQLTDLLRASNIIVPPLETSEEIKSSYKWVTQRPKKWTERISLVVPDDKIKSVFSMIKDYKKNSGKYSSKKNLSVKSVEKSDSINQSCIPKTSDKNKKSLKKSRKIINLKGVKNNKYEKNDSFSGSQSPSQFKENQPVDFNLLSFSEPSAGKNSGSCTSNNNSTDVQENSAMHMERSANEISSSVVNPGSSNIRVGITPKIAENQKNVILSSPSNLLQANTFFLTNDGSLVQLPILNSSGALFSTNSNLLTQATIVKPNAGLLTPIVINKPSPVIVLQKPSPQIIQTAQILNPAPQMISVSKSNVQILNSSVIYTSSNQVGSSKTLPHILSKAPANKKRILRDSTITTYVNKIPIPALAKQSYIEKSDVINSVAEKNKSSYPKTKDVTNKQEVTVSNETRKSEEILGQTMQLGKETSTLPGNEEKNENSNKTSTASENGHKRNVEEEKLESVKKKKLSENLEGNVFKPIENPIETDTMFCNLALPSSINPSLSVSPTAAFLSSFPIVAPTRAEADEDVSEKRTDDDKMSKPNPENEPPSLEKNIDGNNLEDKTPSPKEFLAISPENMSLQASAVKDKKEKSNKQLETISNKNSVNSNTNNFNNSGCGSQNNSIISSNNNSNNNADIANNNIDQGNGNTSGNNVSSNEKNNISHQQQRQQQLDKSWEQYHTNNCDITSETYFLPPDNNLQINNVMASIDTASTTDLTFPSISTNMNNTSYKSYAQNSSVKTNDLGMPNNINEEVALKASHFEFTQKESYMNQVNGYNNERSILKKSCGNNGSDSYAGAKTQQADYQIDSGPSYQLVPAKEVSNARNARTVNWMTEPDVRDRGIVYGAQNDKISTPKTPSYVQNDNFYANNQSSKILNDCSGHFITNDQSKINYQKNDFFMKDQQRCKSMEKRTDPKYYPKTSQNSYNIFDYNYSGSCYNEEESNKYCNVQSYPAKNKKTVNHMKKKSEVQHVANDNHLADPHKRPHEQIITNLDFNPVSNQDCFAWMPGKNVDWLPSKSFGLESNLVVPSTLPTLVGDLALGTNSNDLALVKATTNPKICQPNLKTLPNDLTKDYMDLGMGSNVNMPKSMESVDINKQYLEPFTNLSKNIFDMTPSNVQTSQPPKNDFDKVGFLGTNNNETIILKNIFELPVSKSTGANEFIRQKQRSMNNTQNTFLSVSQLVEPPAFEGNNMKNENQLETTQSKTDLYNQGYATFNNQKSYKSKNKSAQCKYNDRKYQGYKNVSSSYTAEALIRSNNVNCQPNEFPVDINTNYFNGKNSQKPEQFTGNKTDYDINPKTDFQGPNQNIYSDFNFSSPVPNFGIGSAVSATDYGNHDINTNFSTQNNSFFGDFITPEYPLTDNVSNSLLLPPCSISLQSPFVIDKRNVTMEKNKNNSKQFASKNRKHPECAKTSFNEFSLPSSSAIFTTASITCPTIFTTSACQNLLPVPTQSIPISFSSPSFTTSNINFPPLTTTTNNNYKFTNPPQNSSGSFLPSNPMFTTSTSKPIASTHNCYSSSPLTSVSNSVISSSFAVGNVPFSTTSQSTIPFLSLSNPIIPSSAPTSSSNSLANFNLSTIFPEINQKGNYHYS